MSDPVSTNGARHRAGRDLRLVGGAYDGMSAALVERAGFDAVWASGFSIAASKLLPDCSVMTMDDLVAQVAEMTRAVRVPVLVDCDEGYGTLENTRQLVSRLAACGAAGVCIEDSAYPKLNSYCDGPGRVLLDVDTYARRLKVIREAAPDLFLVARTESLIAGLSLEAALDRAACYSDLGVDFVVVHSRFTGLEEFRTVTHGWSGRAPLAVIPTLCEDVSWRELLDLGFAMVIYANQALRASVHAQEQVLRQIRSLTAGSPTGSDLASLEHVFGLTGLNEEARLAGSGR